MILNKKRLLCTAVAAALILFGIGILFEEVKNKLPQYEGAVTCIVIGMIVFFLRVRYPKYEADIPESSSIDFQFRAGEAKFLVD